MLFVVHAQVAPRGPVAHPRSGRVAPPTAPKPAPPTAPKPVLPVKPNLVRPGLKPVKIPVVDNKMPPVRLLHTALGLYS